MELRKLKKRNIKRISLYIVLFSLILGACGRQGKEDTARLMGINQQIQELYSEETEDLTEDISKENFDEIKVKIELEKERQLNKENQKTFEKIVNSYENIVFMYELEEDLQALLINKNSLEEQHVEVIEDLSMRLTEVDSKKWANYVTRQEGKLDEVLAQLEVNRKKATKDVGYFEGMYLSDDNFILYIDNKKTIFTENTLSDGSAYYELQKVINNTGNELTMELYEYPDEMLGIEEDLRVDTYYLSEDHQTVTVPNNRKYHRLEQSEQEAILNNLTGLKSKIENSHRWNY